MLPVKNEIEHINEGLAGWVDNPDILAIQLYPTKQISNCIFNLIHNNIQPNEEEILELARNKTCNANFQRFIIKKLTREMTVYENESREFLCDLALEIKGLDNIIRQIGLSEEEIELFHLFISRTSPILFYMGFSDAINHAAQVAQKCILEAYKRNARNFEILQTAMVGWIHDPKVPLKYSWSNLTTHPIIASAVAINVLHQEDIFHKLKHYLNRCSQNSALKTENYINGIAEALAINNDSEYVLHNGILYRPKWASGPFEPGGVIDQILELSENDLVAMGIEHTPGEMAKILEKNAVFWFETSIEGSKIKEFNKEINLILKHLQFETGIRGLKLKVFEKLIRPIVNKHFNKDTFSAREIFEDLIQGKIQNKQFEEDLRNSFSLDKQQNKDLFVIPMVSGTSLFSHNLELENFTIAALILEIADPLLLSPHKLMVEGVKETSLEQIEDFLESFDKNIIHLPKDSSIGGKIWQRDLYFSLIKAADELTNKNKQAEFNLKLKHLEAKYHPFLTISTEEINLHIIEDQIKQLISLIKDPETWINNETGENYANIKRKNLSEAEKIEKLFNCLKNNYDIAAEKSPEMFGLLTIKV